MNHSRPRPDSDSKSGQNLTRKIAYSSIWLFAVRITDRGLRLIRTIVLAHLLLPEDFGVFGIAVLSFSILETFSNTGFNRALIQREKGIEDYLDATWTIQVIRGIVVSLALFFAAPFASAFFQEPQAVNIVRALGLAVFARGLVNVGIIYFRKELEFQKQFVYEVGSGFIELVVTIVLALIFRNAWALVGGLIAGNISGVVISYAVHSYRPKIDFDWIKIKELFKFGKWILASSILSFLALHGDDIFLGKVLGVVALGLYQMAFLFSNLTAKEIAHVVTQITFPVYSKLQNKTDELREAFLETLEFIIFVCMPVTICILVLGGEFTEIILGAKWLPMVPALKILAVSGFIRAVTTTGSPLFRAVFRPKLDSVMNLSRVLIMAATIFPLTMRFKMVGTSISVLLGILATLPVWFYKTSEIIQVKKYLLLKRVAPFLPGAFIMYSLLFVSKKWLVDINLLELIAINIFAVFCYAAFFVFLWKKAGCGPLKGLERLKRAL